MMSIVSMVETVGELCLDARTMGAEAAALGEMRESNPFNHIKSRYYPTSLIQAWYDGYDEQKEFA